MTTAKQNHSEAAARQRQLYIDMHDDYEAHYFDASSLEYGAASFWILSW